MGDQCRDFKVFSPRWLEERFTVATAMEASEQRLHRWEL